MIELTGNNERDKQIIGFAERRQSWYAIQRSLEDIVSKSCKYPVGDPKELEILEQVRKLLLKIEVE